MLHKMQSCSVILNIFVMFEVQQMNFLSLTCVQRVMHSS